MLLRAVRFAAGLALGVATWWIAAPAYNEILAPVTQLLVHADRRLAAAVLVPQERKVFVTSAAPLPTATMPADQLTYNVILLLALFASNERPWRIPNLRALAIALPILFVSHCIALLIAIESTYAIRQGAWSEQHYGDAAANFWLTSELVFRIVGMFGVVFVAWWALSHSKSVST
jgi:hypothetical protein